MKVVIVGTGNVAVVLGRVIKKAGHEVVQVAGRSHQQVPLLADELQADYTVNLQQLNTLAHLYIVAVTDKNIVQVAAEMPRVNGVVVHTAGSVSVSILKDYFNQYGVLYPLQTLNKQLRSIPEIPIMLDGSSETVKEQLYEFATTWASRAEITNDEKRMTTHIASIVVNNFTNHLMALTEDFCNREGVDFALLFPLIHQTINRLGTMPAAQLQTGPAARGDIAVIDKHLQILNRHPNLKNLYLKLTESIIIYKRSSMLPA